MNYKLILLFLIILNLYQSIDGKKINKKDCKCKLPINSKIIGGRYVKRRYPFMVSLQKDFPSPYNRTLPQCGGSLINHNWILTAAHCVQEFLRDKNKLTELKIKIGIVELNETSKTYHAKRIIIDDRYNGTNSNLGDIALIETKEYIPLTKNIQFACFPDFQREEYDNKIGNLLGIGFGLTVPSKISFPNRLKEVTLNDRSNINPNCKDHLICVGGIKNGDYLCNCDSGSPVMLTVRGLTKIVGVLSFGWGNCDGDSAYSRISYYPELFKKYISNNYCHI